MSKIFFEKYKRIAKGVASNYFPTVASRMSFYEVEQLAMCCLWDIASKGKCNGRDVGHTTSYLKTRIRGYIIDTIRRESKVFTNIDNRTVSEIREENKEKNAEESIVKKSKKRKLNCPKDIRCSVDNWTDEKLNEIRDEKDHRESIENKDVIQHFINSKPVAQHKQLFELLLEGYSQKEIGHILGVTEGRISQIIKGVIARWRRVFLK